MGTDELIVKALDMVDTIVDEFEGDFDTAYGYAVRTLLSIYGLKA